MAYSRPGPSVRTRPTLKTCSSDIFFHVSEYIGKDVKKLGVALDIKEAAMDRIDESKWGSNHIAFKTLNMWKRLQGDQATEAKLAKILEDIGRLDIVIEIWPEALPRNPVSRKMEQQSTSYLTCSIDIFFHVAEHIGKDVKKLGIALGLNEAAMENLERDEGEHGAENVAFDILDKWGIQLDDQATEEKLAENLENIGRLDICRKIWPEALPRNPVSRKIEKPSTSNLTSSNDIFVHVAKHIGKDGKKLGSPLGNEEATIDRIEIDGAKWGSDQMAVKTLEMCKRLQGDQATEEKEVEIIEGIGRIDTRQEIWPEALPRNPVSRKIEQPSTSYLTSSNDVFVHVTKHIGKDGTKLGSPLGIEEATIDRIEEATSDQTAVKTLEMCKRLQGDQATEEKEAEILEGIGRLDIRQEIWREALPRNPVSRKIEQPLTSYLTSSNDIFVHVTKHNGKDGTNLCSALGIEEATIDRIEIDGSTWSSDQMAVKTLEMCERLQGGQVTEEKEAEILEGIGRLDTCQEIWPEALPRNPVLRKIERPSTSYLTCSIDIFFRVAEHIGKDVKKLGIALGLNEAAMENLERDEGEHGAENVAFDILDKWGIQLDDQATEEKLAENLENIGRLDICRKIWPEALQRNPVSRKIEQPSTSYLTSSNDIFVHVTKHIGKDGKKLGSALGIVEGTIDRIEIDGAKWGSDQMAVKTLEMCKRLQGDQATEEKEVEIVEGVGRLDTRQEIWPKALPRKSEQPSTSYLTSSNDIFVHVTKHIGKDGKKLGSALGIEEATIDRIEIDGAKWGSDQMAVKTLEMCKRLQGDQATEEKEAEILEGIGRLDTRQEIWPRMLPKHPVSRKIEQPSTSYLTCSNDICLHVSEHIGKDVKKLGRALGIKEHDMENVELDGGKYGIENVAFRTLEMWKRLHGDQATLEKLAEILEDIGRLDIRREIWPEVLPKNPASRKATRYLRPSQLKLEQLQENLQREYGKLQMKGLPWMKNLCLSMEDHFVELEMINADKSTQQIELNQIFQSMDSRLTQPRILIEGDAGFGKSTIAAKLCYDYSSRANYLKQFDIVLFSSLRIFNGNLEEMLESAADISENQRPEFIELITSKSTLLILDGFDELPRQNISPILDLISGKILPNITLLVTSRPGRFESDEFGKLFSIGSWRDAGYDFTKLWDKRIKIVGISEKRQEEFIQKHLLNFSSSQKEYVMAQMSRMKDFDVLTPDFLRCPLFILMIVLLLTDDKTDLQHLTTKTQLYKGVFNYVMRRFLTKLDAASVETVDLFTTDNVSQSYFDLMKQFGEFSLSAIKGNKLSFTREDILGSNSAKDEQILEIGFLIRTTSVQGFRKMEYYEAVHKSLLEFAAAFYLWNEFVTGPSDEWLNTICSVRPIFPSARSSLLFPFLIGLMGNNACALLDALRPYAAEYNVMFDSLIPTIAEAEMTVNVNKSVSQFLPIQWRTHWTESDISADALFPEIMVEGTKVDKIIHINWVSWYPARFHGDIRVDKLELHIDNQTVPHKDRIECISLLCYFNEGCKWKEFLHLVSFIRFKQISFFFNEASVTSQFLPLIYVAVKMGELKDAEIDYVKCDFSETEIDLIDLITELVKMDRVRTLRIHLFFLPSQKQLGSLFTAISKSSRLTTFILWYQQQTPVLTVDLAQLCNGGQKSYKWLSIENATLECIQPMQNHNLQIELLDLFSIWSTSSTATIFNSYRVMAYIGPLEIVPNDKYELIVELGIDLDATFFTGKLFTHLSQFHKLQTLTLQMMTFNYLPEIIVDEWLLKYVKFLPFLKGIQISDIERNLPLSKEIIECIASYLEKKSVISSSIQSETSLAVQTSTECHQLHLEYLALHVDFQPKLNNPSEWDESYIGEFVSLVSSLKHSVIKKELSRLDILVRGRFSYYMAKFKPNGFFSFNEMFPSSEGFVVRHDLWGMREDDSIEGRMLWDTWSEWNRFSVSC